jgi:serine protease AprX
LVATVFAQSTKLAPDLANLDPNDSIDVIIQLATPSEDAPGPRPGAPRPARPLALGGVNLASQRPVRDLAFINALAARLPAGSLSTLAADPRVKYISPDRPVFPSTQNAIPAINANAAQTAGFTGAGIGIAVIDSGISFHREFLDPSCKALTQRIAYRQDFAPPVPAGSNVLAYSATDTDPYGHGTHVAGILAASGKCASENNGSAVINGIPAPNARFVGVAPQAKLIDLRALNATGSGTDSSVIAAINRAIELKTTYNIRVMNLSLGRPVKESYTLDPLCQAVERAWNAGITVVVAAGNRGRTATLTDKQGKTYRIDGYGTIGSPGNHPLVITVGAMNDSGTPSRTDDIITSYSSKGPSAVDGVVKPDLVAPGNGIFATRPWRGGPFLVWSFPKNISSGGEFMKLNGTLPAWPPPWSPGPPPSLPKSSDLPSPRTRSKPNS